MKPKFVEIYNDMVGIDKFIGVVERIEPSERHI